MPFFPGTWFPKPDPETENGLFKASMLTLMKPWRSVNDLKLSDQTFRQVFDQFIADAPEETRTTINNINFYHECSDCARECTGKRQDIEFVDHPTNCEDEPDAPKSDPINQPEPLNDLFSDSNIEKAIDDPFSGRDLLYA